MCAVWHMIFTADCEDCLHSLVLMEDCVQHVTNFRKFYACVPWHYVIMEWQTDQCTDLKCALFDDTSLVLHIRHCPYIRRYMRIHTCIRTQSQTPTHRHRHKHTILAADRWLGVIAWSNCHSTTKLINQVRHLWLMWAPIYRSILSRAGLWRVLVPCSELPTSC
jgi:hypothetical protein